MSDVRIEATTYQVPFESLQRFEFTGPCDDSRTITALVSEGSLRFNHGQPPSADPRPPFRMHRQALSARLLAEGTIKPRHQPLRALPPVRCHSVAKAGLLRLPQASYGRVIGAGRQHGASRAPPMLAPYHSPQSTTHSPAQSTRKPASSRSNFHS